MGVTTMKILAISDPHGNYSKINDLLKLDMLQNIDMVLIAGDITDFGPDYKAIELIKMFTVPVIAVPGNCDNRGIIEVLNSSKAINLHNNFITIENLTLIGFGGSNPTPFNTPFEMDEDEIEQCLKELLKIVEKSPENNIKLLLTHAPPYETLDEINIGHVGSRAIKKFVDYMDIVVCAHIHEARGVMKVGDTTIVNPVMACHGYAALIELSKPNQKRTVNVELIQA